MEGMVRPWSLDGSSLAVCGLWEVVHSLWCLCGKSDWVSKEWEVTLCSLWLKLEELKTLQQQYLLRNQEVTELRPLKAQLQDHQEQAETMQMMQEELRRESLAWQQELHQLR